jgi:CO dehydrogenase maturation factor
LNSRSLLGYHTSNQLDMAGFREAGMKIAVSGKGGVGKTFLSALLCRKFSSGGCEVIAVDADPDANLAATLGFPEPEDILPISEMKSLIEERTGVKPGQNAPLFKLNPRVDDIPEKYAVRLDGIRLMVMGWVKRGGSGCYCPENTLLASLMQHLVLARSEVVIMDMAAGVEHLGRATARAVDRLIIVVEPGSRSIETARTIKKLAADIGVNSIAVVGNKVRKDSDRDFIKSSLPDFTVLGFLPYDEAIADADMAKKSVLDASPHIAAEVDRIYQALKFK